MAKTPFELKGKTVFVAGAWRNGRRRTAAAAGVGGREVVDGRPQRGRPARSGRGRTFRGAAAAAVFLAAAKVGGIEPTHAEPANSCSELIIQTNMIYAAHARRRKLLFLGSTCIYPKLAPAADERGHACSPGRSSRPTNGYAIAKIAGLKMCQAYRRQYGFDCISAMPTNLYGPGDNFSRIPHVLPALIRKFHEAKLRGATECRGLGHRHAAARIPATSTIWPMPASI